MAYLIIAFFFGLAGGIVGRHKGSSFVIWFIISAVVPFIGLLCAYLYRYESEEPLRHCPNCRRLSRVYETTCPCGLDLDYPDDSEIIEPSSNLRIKSHI